MNLIIAVAALGYFVDVFDMLLFSIVRVESVRAIGIPEADVLSAGAWLLQIQMWGMLLGGVLFGIWGDRRGRVSVLFLSILIYSIATIANAYVTSLGQYAILRFIAGIGLAGELGAGITLVSEIMSSQGRGYGTTIVATFGVAGAVVASVVGERYGWQNCYIVGGCLGLLLLIARIGVHESGLYRSLEGGDVRRGDLLLLCRSRERLFRYAKTILVALPIWYLVGILVTFSPEIGKALHLSEPPKTGRAVMYAYIGFVIGDMASGLLSQFLRSRKKAMGLFLFLTALAIPAYLELPSGGAESLYAWCVPLGFAGGYWAVFITAASEQFGTNLRATVTTTAPNFVRGSTAIFAWQFSRLQNHFSIITSAYILGIVAVIIAGLSLAALHETFGRDLNFIEE